MNCGDEIYQPNESCPNKDKCDVCDYRVGDMCCLMEVEYPCIEDETSWESVSK